VAFQINILYSDAHCPYLEGDEPTGPPEWVADQMPGAIRMSRVVQLALAVSLTTVALTSLHAQLSGYYPITSDGVSLDGADFALLIDAANGLLRQSRLTNGNSVSWRNEQTGAHGTVTVTDTSHHGSMLCHTLTYETNPKASPSANTVKLNWCKTPEGWKILS
jgi:surface antigen